MILPPSVIWVWTGRCVGATVVVEVGAAMVFVRCFVVVVGENKNSNGAGGKLIDTFEIQK